MTPTPKNLVLNLLLAAGESSLSASDAVNSASLFGIRANSVRVALVRLNAQGLIVSSSRGRYRLGPQAAGLAHDLSGWRHALDRVGPWHGHWLMVSTAALGRSDRAALRLRERALNLLGFTPLTGGLFVRPHNLHGDLQALRSRLKRLGLLEDAPLFVASELEPGLDLRARGLWDGKALNLAYVQTHARLHDWMGRASGLDLETAARESYLLGNEAIRQLVFDPLLPAPLVDVDARAAFHRVLIEFDAMGHQIWQRLLPSLREAEIAAMPAPPSSPRGDGEPSPSVWRH